jgi:tRNA/tmRNA/rRNA uracil-C5-methylase (TrmA/RlmC/RlmD family)
MGSPYLEETVLDLKFHLSPTVRFWSNIHAAKMVCRGVEEMLTPSKKNTLLEVCFGGHGLVGLYLSRVRMAGVAVSVFISAVSMLTSGLIQSSTGYQG